MEKDIAKIKKNDNTDIVVRVDDFGGVKGLTIREFVSGDRYTGFTKSGTRIPADKFVEFREAVNSIDLEDMKQESSEDSKIEKLKEELGEIEKEEKEIEDQATL